MLYMIKAKEEGKKKLAPLSVFPEENGFELRPTRDRGLALFWTDFEEAAQVRQHLRGLTAYGRRVFSQVVVARFPIDLNIGIVLTARQTTRRLLPEQELRLSTPLRSLTSLNAHIGDGLSVTWNEEIEFPPPVRTIFLNRDKAFSIIKNLRKMGTYAYGEVGDLPVRYFVGGNG